MKLVFGDGMVDSEEELVESIATLLRVFTMSERKYPPAEGRMRYSGLDFETLEYIEKHKHARASDIADHVGVSATTMQSVVDRLVRRNLVERERGAGRGRTVPLALTQEGRGVRDAIHRQNVANCRIMMEAIAPGERAKFISQMQAIARHVSS
jgi:DNA-binding MarR family transcriptional regulator